MTNPRDFAEMISKKVSRPFSFGPIEFEGLLLILICSYECLGFSNASCCSDLHTTIFCSISQRAAPHGPYLRDQIHFHCKSLSKKRRFGIEFHVGALQSAQTKKKRPLGLLPCPPKSPLHSLCKFSLNQSSHKQILCRCTPQDS